MSLEYFIPARHHASITLIRKGAINSIKRRQKATQYPKKWEDPAREETKRHAEIAAQRVVDENKKKYGPIYDEFFNRGGPAWYEAIMGDPLDIPRIYRDITYLTDCIQRAVWQDISRQVNKTIEAEKFRRREMVITLSGKGHVKSARYRTALIALGTSSWADMGLIQKVYEERDRMNKQGDEAYHVDHIVPIVHNRVCGLHNQFNLRVITKEENLRKSNKFKVEK